MFKKIVLQLVVAVITFVLYMLRYREIAIDEGASENIALSTAVRSLWGKKDFKVVVLASSLLTGVSIAWQGVLQMVLKNTFSSKQTGIVACQQLLIKIITHRKMVAKIYDQWIA